MKLFDSVVSALTGNQDSVQAYEPTHMKRDQVMQESGGRQLDKDGKPLVGRYPNGKTPPKGQEAYGIAQMQIRTARNTAAKHGIPWDQNKFMTDADYNLQLGDRHMGDLKAKYGDEKTARAAYYSGEPTVDRAIAKYGKENFHQGLGPLGRDYIGKGAGSGSNGVQNVASKVPQAPDLSAVKATPGEVKAMSSSAPSGNDPFTSGPRVTAAWKEQARRSSVADLVLAAAVEKSDAVRAQQTQALESTVAAKKGINEHQRLTTEAQIAQAIPVFQKRQEVVNRRVEIGGMNPFLAAIKGAVDPNYNRDYLDGMDQALTRKLQTLDESYKGEQQLYQTLSTLAAADFNDQDSLFKLQLANHGQDVQNAVMSWESQSRILNDEIDGLAAGSSLIAAQTTARNDTLSGLTDGQLNEAIKLANNNNGVAVVNGVSLRLPELNQLATNRQEQEYALESHQLAIEGQRLGFAEKAAEKVIDTMSEAEVKTAIANGGMFKGSQLDVTKLGSRLVNLQQTQAAMVQGQMTEDASASAIPMFKQLAQQTSAEITRMGGIFGKVPDEYAAYSRTLNAEARSFIAGLKKATAAGVGEEYKAANLPRIDALMKQRAATVAGIAKRWSGGNADMESLANAWINGAPLDSGAAMKGLIHMAKNGAPAGTQFTGPAAQVFAVVKEEVNRESAPAAGTDVNSMAMWLATGDKPNKEEAERKLIQRIQGRISSTYNESVINGVILRTPSLAAKVPGPNGGPHPFSRIPQEKWAAAVHAGDEQGYATTGAKLGLSDKDFKLMLAQGASGPLWQSVSAGKKGPEAQFSYWEKILAADQARQTMSILDANIPREVTGGMRPSQAYANLMHSPQWRQTVSNETRVDKLGTFAGFVTSQAGAGNVDGAYQNYADTVFRAYNGRAADSMARTAQRVSNLGSNPVERTRYMLGAIDGLSAGDEKKMLDYITGMIPKPSPVPMAVMDPLNPSASNFETYPNDVTGKIDSFILTGKSDDPDIERIRKHVQKQWGQVTAIAGRAHDKYFQGE